MHANQTHKLETDIDRRQIILALLPHAIRKKRFDVRFHPRQGTAGKSRFSRVALVP